MNSEPEHHHFHLASSYRRHMANPRRERAFLHAAGFTGSEHEHRSASRATAFASGLATAVTLDEFALWFDLADDYWTPAGRKSIDAILLFAGVSVMGLTGRDLLHECGRAGRAAWRDLRF